MAITIDANKEAVGKAVLNQATLWYLVNNDNVLTYNRVSIELTGFGSKHRIGGISTGLCNIINTMSEDTPIYKLSECPDFSALLLYVGRQRTQFGYEASNSHGDGTTVFFYDIHQNFIRRDFIPTPNIGKDKRYHYKGSFKIDSKVHFMLFGSFDAGLDIEKITLK